MVQQSILNVLQPMYDPYFSEHSIVLDELDRELEVRGLSFARYADDCNIFVGSKRSAERVMAGYRPVSAAMGIEWFERQKLKSLVAVQRG